MFCYKTIRIEFMKQNMLKGVQKQSKLLSRLLKTRVNFEELSFRRATPLDKSTVLSLRHNVYGGLDYLADYYDYFVQDRNRQCFVGELDGKVVSFGAMLFLDGGHSILGQAGRVHEMHEGRGIFSAMNQFFNKTAVEYGCKRRVALVETSFNKHARSEKFKRTHIEITSKLNYAGVVTEEVRRKLEERALPVKEQTNIKDFTLTDMEEVLNTEILSKALFPRNRLLLDFVPYRGMTENVDLFKGRNTSFYSSISTSSSDVTGLLTAGSSYKCTNPPESYTIDIFGTHVADLEDHIHFHLTKAMKKIQGEFCLQIFVGKGYIAQNLCKALIKLDIPKCEWYVAGGIGTKTIVEDILR